MNLVLVLTIIGIITFILGIVLYQVVFKPKHLSHGFLILIWMFVIPNVCAEIYDSIVDPMEYREEKHEWYIESLGNDKSIEGDFTLGSGAINEVDYYFFFVKTARGYKRMKLRASGTYIIETDSRKPEYVEIWKRHDDENSFWKVLTGDRLYNKLYVPKGTIIKDFKVR